MHSLGAMSYRHIVIVQFKADAPATVKPVADVAADDLILDIGPQTAATLAAQIATGNVAIVLDSRAR